MSLAGLRVALFSGNYNCVRDGANQALNRLVGYLLREGAAVRIYSPTVKHPAFAPTGDLVSVPSVAFPFGRDEYRWPLALSPRLKRDLADFAPDIVHVASPDVVAHRAATWARKRGVPVLASVHTRFETYLQYYKLGWSEPLALAILRRFYQRCDALVAPSESMASLLRAQGMNDTIGLWSRGVDRTVFDPGKRDMEWRRSIGISDDAVVIGLFSRLVMEKGLDVFADVLDELRRRGVPHRILIVGDGPAMGWLQERLPDAIYAGHLGGHALGCAVASMDVLFFPSVTETFGNVTLEAMACGVPAVASAATGSASLVLDHQTGRLIEPGAVAQFADALATYVLQPKVRADHGTAAELRSRSYSWDQINSVVAEMYRQLIKKRFCEPLPGSS